jgi:heparosan-N-sulfate-glucuronate 5-epimerase
VDITVGNVSHSAQLGGYYLDFSVSADQVAEGLYGPFDGDGVPLVDYDRLLLGSPNVKRGHVYGIHYTPVTIAQYGLGLHSACERQANAEQHRLFLKMADWHVDNLVDLGAFSVWPHHFEFPIFNLSPPWVSGMAQGQGISLLLRAYQDSADERYLDAARCAMAAFDHDVAVGGAAVTEGADDLWLEEYPNKPASHVLNGFIFALWGVMDYHRVTKDAWAGAMVARCVATLARNMDRFEGFYWSRYDLVRSGNSSMDYHKLHVMQLDVMAALTSEPVLLQVAQRWRAYVGGKDAFKRTLYRYARGLLRRAGFGFENQSSFVGIVAPCK